MERYFLRVCDGKWLKTREDVWRRARENSPGCLGSLELLVICDDEADSWSFERWEHGRLVDAYCGSGLLDVMGFALPAN